MATLPNVAQTLIQPKHTQRRARLATHTELWLSPCFQGMTDSARGAHA